MADPLDQLAADLEALKVEFERYFIGVEKRLPGRQRDELSRAIRRYSPGNDAIERFRHQGLVQRLGAYDRYWNRVLRAIEEGTYERDRKRADYREKQRDPAPAQASAPEEAAARRKATEVGDEAAAFLARLTGGGPAVGLRGKPVGDAPSRPSGGTVPVGLRGRPVADRPSLDTREIVRKTLTPESGIERPSVGTPAVGLRGRPVASRTSGQAPVAAPRVSGSQPAVPRPSGGSLPVAPVRSSGGQPAVPRPSGGSLPVAPVRSSGSQPAVSPPAGLAGLSRRSGGLVSSLGIGGSKPPAPPAPPSRPVSAAPPVAEAPAPRGRPMPRSRTADPAPEAAPRSPIPPMRGAPKAPPPAPMRGAPKAPPPAPMRGAPKNPPPSPPLRGRPVGED